MGKVAVPEVYAECVNIAHPWAETMGLQKEK